MAQLHNLPDPVLWVFPVVVWQSFLQWQAGRLPLNHWGSLSTIQVLLGRFPLLPHTTSRWHGWNIVLYFLPSTSVNNVHSNKILLSYQAYLLSDLWLEVSCIFPNSNKLLFPNLSFSGSTFVLRCKKSTGYVAVKPTTDLRVSFYTLYRFYMLVSEIHSDQLGEAYPSAGRVYCT